MTFVSSPDVILCVWSGSKQPLTRFLFCCCLLFCFLHASNFAEKTQEEVLTKEALLSVVLMISQDPDTVPPCPHVVGMLRFFCFLFVSDVNQPSLPIPFYFYSVIVSDTDFMALSTVFHFINSPNNSPHSHFSLLISALLVLLAILSLYESLFQPWYNPLWLTGF